MIFVWYRIGEFFRDNSDTLKIVSGIVVMLAGFIVMVYHTLIGLLLIFGGILLAILAISKIMRIGGYNGHAGANFGMGQQQSGVLKDNNPGAANEVDSGIWDAMTGDTDKR